MKSEAAANALQLHLRHDDQARDLRLLWVVTLEPSVGESHGAGMRFLNFARELSAAGAQVYFAAQVDLGEDAGALRQFLEELKQAGTIAGFVLLSYRCSKRQSRRAALALYPGLGNRLLKNEQREPVDRLKQFIRDNDISNVIVSDRKLFFIGDALRTFAPTLLDWTDSLALHYSRGLAYRLKHREFDGMFGFLRDFQSNVLSEFYYGRRAVLNALVSPVDKKWFDRTSLRPSRNRLWLNGTKTEVAPPLAKIPKRLIFTGAMDYAPNYEGALWFIDNVLPLISERHPETKFIVAGVNPVQKLRSKANEQISVTGFVSDLRSEIAQSALYVAPLLSGGGFRNKVIEAITNGTYVVGTPISVEFLPAQFQRLLSVASDARSMADLVISHLDQPEACRPQLKQLQQMVAAEYSWRQRSRDLVGFLKETEELFIRQPAGRR